MTDQKDMTSNDDMPRRKEMPVEIWAGIHGMHGPTYSDSPVAGWFRYTRTDTLNQQAATPAPVEPAADAEYWKAEANRYAQNADYWRERFESVEPQCTPDCEWRKEAEAHLIEYGKLAAAVEPSVEALRKSAAVLAETVRQVRIGIRVPDMELLDAIIKTESALSTLQPAPEQECTCPHDIDGWCRTADAPDCPLHGFHAKKEPPADQEAVRDTLKAVVHILRHSHGDPMKAIDDCIHIANETLSTPQPAPEQEK